MTPTPGGRLSLFCVSTSLSLPCSRPGCSPARLCDGMSPLTTRPPSTGPPTPTRPKLRTPTLPTLDSVSRVSPGSRPTVRVWTLLCLGRKRRRQSSVEGDSSPRLESSPLLLLHKFVKSLNGVRHNDVPVCTRVRTTEFRATRDRVDGKSTRPFSLSFLFFFFYRSRMFIPWVWDSLLSLSSSRPVPHSPSICPVHPSMPVPGFSSGSSGAWARVEYEEVDRDRSLRGSFFYGRSLICRWRVPTTAAGISFTSLYFP